MASNILLFSPLGGRQRKKENIERKMIGIVMRNMNEPSIITIPRFQQAQKTIRVVINVGINSQ